MNEECIKGELFKNFEKWFKTTHWNLNKQDITETHIKQYLGYFGINRRGQN